MSSKHRFQRVEKDEEGVERFVENAIVRHLVDRHPGGLNALAEGSFPREDWVQLAQLIGYSTGGWGSLSYVTDEDWERFQKKANR